MSQSPKIVTIANASQQHPRHSEPAVMELRDGSLLLAWQEYLQSELEAEDNAPNRISAMTSRDGGYSWSDHRILIENTPGDVNVYSTSFIRLEETGEILFFFPLSRDGGGEENPHQLLLPAVARRGPDVRRRKRGLGPPAVGLCE